MTSQTTHTPGPWHIGTEQDYSIVDRYAKNAEWARVRGPNGELVAKIESVHPAGKRQSKDFDIEASNARLIAAAPELLAALHKVYANAAESPEWIRMIVGPVIAKATGKQ